MARAIKPAIRPAGGLRARGALRENGLSIVITLLFLAFLVAQALVGVHQYNEEQIAHGGAPVSVLEYVDTARFWFESFQNWQSEFLALIGMIVLSIFLRQRGSPESKPVDAPHSQTGSD